MLLFLFLSLTHKISSFVSATKKAKAGNQILSYMMLFHIQSSTSEDVVLLQFSGIRLSCIHLLQSLRQSKEQWDWTTMHLHLYFKIAKPNLQIKPHVGWSLKYFLYIRGGLLCKQCSRAAGVCFCQRRVRFMCLIWVNCMLIKTLPERFPDASPAHQRSRQLKPPRIRAENAASAPHNPSNISLRLTW